MSVVLLQAVGETWDKTPELKFLALKRMYKYMVCSQPHLSFVFQLTLKGRLQQTH